MASKLTALTELTTPTLDDIVYIVDAPGSAPASKKVTVQNLRGGYALQAYCAASSPADNTTYYWGSQYTLALTTTPGTAFFYPPRAGTITVVQLALHVTGTLGTTETSTMSLRLNNTTDTTISSAVRCDAATAIYTASISVAVLTTDYIEMKWATPAGGWATNPTNVIWHASIYIT